jgi:hypothetical protein
MRLISSASCVPGSQYEDFFFGELKIDKRYGVSEDLSPYHAELAVASGANFWFARDTST